MSDLGVLVRNQWVSLARRLPNVELGAFVVMPNHIHGIITIVRSNPHRAQGQEASCFTETMLGKGADSTNRSHAEFEGTLGAIVRSFKSVSTREARRVLGDARYCLWQRSYHEHVVRGYKSLHAIQQYINENPLHWAHDPDHPDCMGKTHR
ncbi:MAG: hypothetical protein NTU88_10620 [Armatimonadetes bacterium]|nr:hypothetical protein [Armatimonadota bacterium]